MVIAVQPSKFSFGKSIVRSKSVAVIQTKAQPILFTKSCTFHMKITNGSTTSVVAVLKLLVVGEIAFVGHKTIPLTSPLTNQYLIGKTRFYISTRKTISNWKDPRTV